MRISDWSSDVCSSDLPVRGAEGRIVIEASRFTASAEHGRPYPLVVGVDDARIGFARRRRPDHVGAVIAMTKLLAGARAIVAFPKALPDDAAAQPVVLETKRRAEGVEIAPDRTGVVKGQSVTVRVDLGGGRSM